MNTNHGATSLKDFDETDVAGDVTAQLDTLKAENTRLQKALEAIVLESINHGWIADIEVIAREALQEAQS